jgi:hypothetical protein
MADLEQAGVAGHPPPNNETWLDPLQYLTRICQRCCHHYERSTRYVSLSIGLTPIMNPSVEGGSFVLPLGASSKLESCHNSAWSKIEPEVEECSCGLHPVTVEQNRRPIAHSWPSYVLLGDRRLTCPPVSEATVPLSIFGVARAKRKPSLTVL